MATIALCSHEHALQTDHSQTQNEYCDSVAHVAHGNVDMLGCVKMDPTSQCPYARILNSTFMKRIIILLVPILISSLSFAQSVGIGTTTPDSSAILDLKSNSKGLLIPRMTTAQRDSLHQPAPGLQILNLDDHCIDIYDGTYWIKNCGMKITGMDTITSIWSYVGEWGGAERQGAVAFTIGSKG